MHRKNFATLIFVALVCAAFGCRSAPSDNQSVTASSLRDIPALKLNFRFEPDTPAPEAANQQTAVEEKNAVIQNDFDTNRSPEMLERTLTSPDKQRILAVYRKPEDAPADFRLDMYAADGTLLRRVTPNGMAVRFPDTIVWSPDSNNVAFVASTRVGQPAPQPEASPTPSSADANANTEINANVEENVDANTNADPNTNTVPAAPTPEPAKPVLTFRTEQIYLSNREGTDLRPLTQNEGLIYFYFLWAPDSSALVSLAATWREWQVSNIQAEQRGEIFVPAGRPRLVERTGRERRLDDNVTTVQPVWSPDSAKVALAFIQEIRVYDAIGDAPTQAAIPLRNPLLISSKTYDDELRRKEQSGEANADANTNANTNADANANANLNANAQTSPVNTDVSALPDESMLVSFNPIIKLLWAEDNMLYFQTGFVREYRNSSENRYSYLRWHRLILSPQPTALN